MKKVKVFNGTIKVDGKCYAGIEKGREKSDWMLDQNPLKEYNNSYVFVKDTYAYAPHWLTGEFICKLQEIPKKHFKYYK